MARKDWNSENNKLLIEQWIEQFSNDPLSARKWGVLMACALKGAAIMFEESHSSSLNDARRHFITEIICSLKEICEKDDDVLGCEVARALTPLVGELYDIECGINSPVFTPPKRPGNKISTVELKVTRGISALAMSLLIQSGDSVPTAARKVCRAVVAGGKAGSQKCTPGKIKRWRDIMKQGASPITGEKGVDLIIYEQPLPPEAGNTPKEQADFLLAKLRSKNLINRRD